jgi:hypothetical protein
MGDRQRRRQRKREAAAGKRYATVAIGDGMVVAAPDAIAAALERLPATLDWPTMAAHLVPMLPRRRPMPLPGGPPVEVLLPPGIQTGFAVDIGPAYLRVDATMLAGWAVDPLTLVATSLENVRARTRSIRTRDLLQERIDGMPVRLLQSGVGCAAALLLVEDELQRILGSEPQLLLAPMRDVLVSLDPDTDRGFAAWLNEELAAVDPNGLALEAFVLEGRSLRYEPLPRAA